ncbi:hypothetical protein BKA82DRAFT_4018350 [Pisolithus tinctorius]|nr:hypothetical protein BKA82DRAFT_4018350 [Pisolithus tinctorius]
MRPPVPVGVEDFSTKVVSASSSPGYSLIEHIHTLFVKDEDVRSSRHLPFVLFPLRSSRARYLMDTDEKFQPRTVGKDLLDKRSLGPLGAEAHSQNEIYQSTAQLKDLNGSTKLNSRLDPQESDRSCCKFWPRLERLKGKKAFRPAQHSHLEGFEASNDITGSGPPARKTCLSVTLKWQALGRVGGCTATTVKKKQLSSESGQDLVGLLKGG